MKEKILYVDLPGYKALPNASILKLAGQDWDTYCVTELQSALTAIERLKNIKVLLCNAPKKELFQAFEKANEKGIICLITDKPMEKYAKELEYQEDKYLNHIIANRSPTIWTARELHSFLNKIILDDYFGIDKYLDKGTPTIRIPISGKVSRDDYNQQVIDFAQSKKVGTHLSKILKGISEELLMNALLDAPHAAKQLNNQAEIEDASFLEFGCDTHCFAISVQDPYGALSKHKLFTYLKKVLVREDESQLIDTKKEGAGLGLFKIFYSSHALVCNVVPGKKTEVMSLVDLSFKVKDFSKIAKSIYFFQQKSDN